MTEWSWCLLPAGMKWRLAAFPPDPQIIMQKKKSPHQRRRHLNAIRAAATAPLGVRKALSFNAVVFPCNVPNEKRPNVQYLMYGTPSLPPPQRLLPHTSVRVYPPGLGNVWNLHLQPQCCVCLLLCRPTDTASQLPSSAGSNQNSLRWPVRGCWTRRKKRSFGTRG